ncbi:probable G-protein coupled receptor 141 [Nerophis lumbriciformis]|uniref:probable G-protein coupled receptor 141 n=1 Tax=Nerophis lumbriciformis TaxID=546530 RepID=UPI002ADFA396|nr:probable G-protein coupled receptor 141 [Nerophis lumbriciformis]XP_061821513.1 probable G-protein coupled receptor 141 [Nerophis lumbriciformis]
MASNSTFTPTSLILTSKIPRNKSTVVPRPSQEHNMVLIVIYTLVLLIGATSLSLTILIMKLRTASTTSIAVLNLVFAHFLFLLTVPFRIYYYATQQWSLGLGWCKVVSSMIHIHMYMSFSLYVIILVTRLLAFYGKRGPMASPPRIYALAASVVVWILMFVCVTCIICFLYGKNTDSDSQPQCFRFGKKIDSTAVVINYIISTLFITVTIVLCGLQVNVLWLLYRKHQQLCTSQQDFDAQLKSLCFVIIMVVCFIPYHVFRFYYLENISRLQDLNELFLSLTTFNCLDMLTLLGRRTCSLCLPGRAI